MKEIISTFMVQIFEAEQKLNYNDLLKDGLL